MVRKILAVFTRTIQNRRVSLLVYLVIGIGMMEMFISLFPSFREQAEAVAQAYQNLPEGLFAAFGIEELTFSTIEGFLATEHFSFMWPLLVILMLTGISAALAGEIEKGTIELVLSRPISRSGYFIGKYLAGFVTLVVFVAGSTLVAAPFASLHGLEYQFQNFLSLALMGFLFGWAVLSLGFLVSSWLSDKNRVFFISGGILFVMYVLNILARLLESLEGLKYISFFHYFNGNILVTNEISLTAVIVFIVFSIVATSVAIWRWQKRDIPA